MAEKESKGPDKDLLVEIVFLLAGLWLFMVIMNRLADYLYYYFHGETYGDLWSFVVALFTQHIWPFLVIFGIIISIASIGGIIYNYQKLLELNQAEKELYGLKEVPLPMGTEEIEKKNESWEAVTKHINSPNPSDWRLAVIEADIMLDDLLRAAGYHGETTGDMLKAVEKSDFTTIENAWEAHKVRNKIAHSGTSFPLNEREAKQTIALYESVFKEFKII